jgi:hypothetical protein
MKHLKPFIKEMQTMKIISLEHLDYEEWKTENTDKKWSFEKWKKWSVLK